LWLVATAALVLILPAVGLTFEIKQAGKLQVARDTRLFAFSTDSTIQEVLSQDFSAVHRSADAATGKILTVTVNVSQQSLRPGVSLNQLAPGDPQVADLIRAAGGNPPPLGDTGDQYDQVALARRMAAQDLMPHDTQAAKVINSMSQPAGGFSELGMFAPPLPVPCAAQKVARPGCPPVPDATSSPGDSHAVGDVQRYIERGKQGRGLFGSAPAREYDTVVVARASVTGVPEEMTLVAISHAGEDVDNAKKHIAEAIANSILN
jgi:hypothetical protein